MTSEKIPKRGGCNITVLVVNFGPRPHRLRLLRATKKGCRRDLGRKNNVEEGLKKDMQNKKFLAP